MKINVMLAYARKHELSDAKHPQRYTFVRSQDPTRKVAELHLIWGCVDCIL